MKKIHEISDYRILGYSDKDKAELQDRQKSINLVKRTSEELKIARCSAYTYLIK